MQHCPVCGNTGFDAVACPVCGFDESLDHETYLSLVPLRSGALSLQGRRAAWEREQKRRQLDALEIVLESYYYTVDDDSMTLSRTQEIRIAEGGKLSDGVIAWSTVQFPRIDDMDQLPITLFVKRGDERRRRRVVVDNPGGGKTWHVGVRLRAGDHPEAELVVGTEDNFTCSDRFSLEV